MDPLPLPPPGEVADDDNFASAPFIKLYCDVDDDDA